MPTANFNLPIYTATDTAALDTLLNGQSNAIDAALLATEGRTIGTDAARTALIAPRRKEGLEWYANDTNIEWKYDGSNWVTNEGGLYLIRPTSVAGGTVNSVGAIVPTAAAATLQVNGVFSDRFREYVICYKYSTTDPAGGSLRLRASGASLASAVYNTAGMYDNGTNIVRQGVAGATAFGLPTSLATWQEGEVTLKDPRLTANPKFMRFTGGGVSASTFLTGYAGGTAGDAYIADGFEYILSTSVFSAASATNGYFKVYGKA